jgi:hypothetical protein
MSVPSALLAQGIWALCDGKPPRIVENKLQQVTNDLNISAKMDRPMSIFVTMLLVANFKRLKRLAALSRPC